MKNNLLFCISMIMVFSIWPGLTQTAYTADNPCYIVDVQFNNDNIIETNIIIDNIKASVGSFALDYDASVVRMVYKVEDYSIEKYKIVQQDTDFEKIGEQERGISTFINDDVQWIDTNQGYYMFNWYGNKGTIDAVHNSCRIQTLYFETLPGASKADINTNTFRLVSDYKILY